nr:MAG TPA: hypothetical protein [Caudoviricetes sp.]
MLAQLLCLVKKFFSTFHKNILLYRKNYAIFILRIRRE